MALQKVLVKMLICNNGTEWRRRHTQRVCLSLERLCGDMSRGGDGDELAQYVLGRLQVVLGDHQGFLDVLDGVALGHQALNLPVQSQAASRRRRGRGGGGG